MDSYQLNPSSVSFRAEFKRSFQRYNLLVAFFSSLGITGLAFFLFRDSEGLPIPIYWISLLLFLSLFCVITFLHAMMHCYWGWRFGKGISAHIQGNHSSALSLLSPVEWPGMNHYDLENKALEALQQSRTMNREFFDS